MFLIEIVTECKSIGNKIVWNDIAWNESECNEKSVGTSLAGTSLFLYEFVWNKIGGNVFSGTSFRERIVLIPSMIA